MELNDQLLEACQRGIVEDAQNLITQGADINAKNNVGDTPLHIASMYRHPEVVELLLSRGAEVNEKNVRGFTPLRFASSTGNTEVAELLLSRGANVNVLDMRDWSPLYTACISRKPEMFKLLLYRGANIDDEVLRCIADKPELKTILKEWYVVMGVEVLDANGVYRHLDTDSITDLKDFLGGKRKRNKKSKKNKRKTYSKKRKTFKRK
jgi:ankyrin repeat protein